MAYPRILHNNIIAKAASVVASSTGAGYAVANLSDGRPYTWWAPSAAPATLEIDAGVAMEADGLYIPTHTLDSSLWDVSLYAADLPFSGMQLLTAPEDLNNAAWAKSGGITVTVNSTAAPDGTTTADTINFSAGTDYLVQALAAYPAVIGASATLSLYAKTTTQIITFGGASPTGTDVYSVGNIEANGFYRQTITRTFTETTSAKPLQGLIYGTLFGIGSVAAWGALLNAGSIPAPYIPVTPGRWISETALCFSNRVTNPNDLSTAGVGIGITRTGGAAYAPNGKKEATLVQDTATAGESYLEYSFIELHYAEGGQTAGLAIAKTVGDPNYSLLSIVRAIGGSTDFEGIVIDTNSGIVSAPYGTPASYGIEDFGDFWFAWVKASATMPVSNSDARIRFYPCFNATGSAAQDNTRTGSKFIWGGKLEKTLGRPAPYRQDAPIYLPFTNTTKRYWLLRLNRKSGSALAAMAVCMVGKALTFPTGLPQGTDPLGRKVMGQRNQNERGQPLGRTVDYEYQDVQLKFEKVSWAWLRGVFVPAWRRGLRSEPFGFIWDYEAAVEDVALVTASEDFRTPHNSGNLADLQLTVSGVVT